MSEREATAAAREMVETQLRGRGITDARVLQAMRDVPRHRFVPELSIEQAYSDRALPTADGQTISQPYIVAKMTELLAVGPSMRVLEVGTGSGYQTAILAELAARVVSLERSQPLADHARRVLGELGYADRAQVLIGDGTLGHAPSAPYDRILVTAAAPSVPQSLCDQLADDGVIVLPLGDREAQRLTVVRRRGHALTYDEDIPCRFVPLIGRQGWDEA